MTIPAIPSRKMRVDPGSLLDAQDSPGMREENYRELFAAMTEGFALHQIVCDGDGKPCDYRFLRVNPAFEEMTGLKSGTIVGKTVKEVFPEIEPWWIETYGKVALTGSNAHFEHYFPLLKKYFEVKAFSPRKGEFAVVFSDITPRKKVENHLRESEERYRLLVENCQGVVCEVDEQRRFLYLSPNFSAVFGYEPSELLGACAMDLMHPEDRAAMRANHPFGGEINGMVFRHSHKDGSWRWVELNIREFINLAGEKRGVGILRDITRRRAADERLRQLSRAVEQNPATVVITDTKGHIEYVNPKFTETTGYTYEEAIGKNPRILKSGELSAETYREMWRTITSGGTWVGELHNRKRNGELFWELASISPIFDEQGVITHFVAVKEDITAQKQMLESLHRSEAQFRTICEASPLGVFLMDENLRCVYSNKAQHTISGRTFGEVAGAGWREAFHPEDRERVIREWEEIAKTKKSFRSTRRYLHKDGRIVWTGATIAPIQDRDGVGGYVGIVEDVTKRHEMSMALKESEARFRTICEASPLGIFRTDEMGGNIYVNEAFSRVTGRTPEQMSGSGWREAIHPEDRERVDTEWSTIRQTHEPFQSTRRYCHEDGKIIWADVTISPIRDHDAVRGFIGLVQDITERRQMNEQLLRSQRMESIGTLASGVAHDLNNILAPILMSASFLHELVPLEARSLTLAIEESARRGADIVKQVLTFARGIEGERVSLQPRHLIKEVEEISRETFPKSIHIRQSVPKNLWMIIGDSTQVHQVLLNLFINARDAMPDGGSLTVAAENLVIDEIDAAMHPDAKPGRYVAISVADSGTGISPKIIDKIFDPFFTTKEVGKGTGLGLSTVIGIVKSHGGFVKVYSEYGKGSTFKAYLPASPGDQPDSQPKDQPALPSGNGEWILLVDDESAIRKVTETMLKRNGYNVLVAADGIEAVTLYARHMQEIRVVLTDVVMPLLDGVKLTIALKKMNQDVAIIASTGQADDSHQLELKQLGVNSVLLKPYHTENLLTLLQETIHGGSSKG